MLGSAGRRPFVVGAGRSRPSRRLELGLQSEWLGRTVSISFVCDKELSYHYLCSPPSARLGLMVQLQSWLWAGRGLR